MTMLLFDHSPTPARDVTCRLATAVDLPAVVRMAREFLTTIYAHELTDNPAQLFAIGEQLLASEQSVIFVAEEGGALVGVIAMMVYEHPMSADRVASEVIWWVDPAHRGIGRLLLARAEAWARERGAVILQLVAPSDRVAEMYERWGFRRIETTYHRKLS